MAIPDWKGKNLDLIKEACRLGEATLSAQVAIANAADQRAVVLAGIYVTASTAIIGAMTAHGSFAGELPLAVGAGTAALAFLAGSILCILPTLPVDIWPPGNSPREWYEDIRKNTPIEVAIGEQAEHFGHHIVENNRTIATNAKWFSYGAVTGIFAPVAGLAAAGVTYLLAA